MASFQAKIGWKMPRKREYKIYRSFPKRNLKFQNKSKKIIIIVPFRSFPTRNSKFQKNSNKIQKLKYTIMASFQAKIGW